MQIRFFKNILFFLFVIFNIDIAADTLSWRGNYKHPKYFQGQQKLTAQKDHSISAHSNDEQLRGLIFEIDNAEDTSMDYVVDELNKYLLRQEISNKSITKTSRSYIFLISKNNTYSPSYFYNQFAKTLTWLMFNRQNTSVSIRPIFDAKGVFNPSQAIYLDPPQVFVGHHRTKFVDPETAIVDGFHIHMDYLKGQETKAFTLRDQFVTAMAQNKVIYSDLDDYPEKSNGPHNRAGWEVKFERVGSLALENYGQALIWLMLHHEDIPIYSHSKSWVFGENEKRLVSHLDNALYSGIKPSTNQWFFFDPDNQHSGLYRWDSQLPVTLHLSKLTQQQKIDEVLTFWFGNTKEVYPLVQSKKWFMQQNSKQSLFDKEIAQKFSRDLTLFVNHSYDSWLKTPKGTLAAIILLDQFPRNIYRGQRMAFAYDALSLKIAKEALQKGFDKKLTIAERLFMYLPLEHSENIVDQTIALNLIQKLKEEAPKRYDKEFNIHYQMAKKHKITIEKFKYFPSRNLNYGIQLTVDEKNFLQQKQANF